VGVTESGGDANRSPHEERAATRDYAFRVYAVDDADEIRLRDLWQVVWRGKWLIVSAALGTAILAIAVTFLITPVYRSSVLLVPTIETTASSGLASLATQFAGVASLAGVNLASGNRTAEAIATLRSRLFTEKFIREHNLLPILYADSWDEDARRWRDGADEGPTMWEAYERFDSLRNVEEDLTTGLIAVSVNWTDPKLAAEWANWLVADVNHVLRTRAIRESQQNLDFLRTELQKNSQVPLQTTIFGLIEAEMKNAMLANVRQEYAFKVIDPAVMAEKRSWPNRLLFAVLGLFVGGVIGTFAASLLASPGKN
jgi:uncharacterized protein involved in exopolysaccharide biosynthesis